MVATTSALRAIADVPRHPTEFRFPVFLLGVGLGAFIDGIVMHQLLQWHHMISDTSKGAMDSVAGLEANTVADGLFHLFAFVVVVVALYLAMRVRRADFTAVLPPSRVLAGWLLVGWATFNIVEGVANHHLLRVHHVRDDVADPLGWDVAFLVISDVLLLIGVALIRRGRPIPVALGRHPRHD